MLVPLGTAWADPPNRAVALRRLLPGAELPKDSAAAVWTRRSGVAAPQFLRPRAAHPGRRAPLAEMVGDYSGVNWTSPDPHAPHPNSIELLAAFVVGHDTCRRG
jgi:hypothetical protein